MKYELLVKKEFWNDFYNELGSAKKRVYVQFLTFEGDKTGLKLAKELIELKRKGLDVKVLIDRFSDYYVSDTYYKRKEVRDEVIATKAMIEAMEKSGIKVKRTHPYGPGNIFFLDRNHKKIIVIDEVCYLGGMNISDHNKNWYDFMVKIKEKNSLKSVVNDFNYTFAGKFRNYKGNNIITNKKIGKTFSDLIKGAKKEVIISSPYAIDISLIKIFKDKKIKKVLLTLKNNNQFVITNMSKYIYRRLIEDGMDIFQYSNFSHAKFLVIDRNKLLIGSSNFGKESFISKQEICILIEDKKFVKNFVERLYVNDRKKLVKYRCPRKRFFKQNVYSHFIYYLLLAYSRFVVRKVKLIG